MTIYFKVLLTLIICTIFALMWHASSAVEASEKSQLINREMLELSLSGTLSAKLDIAKFKYTYCTEKEIVFLSNNVSPFDVRFSFQSNGLDSQGWQHYSLDSTQPLKLNILEFRKKGKTTSFHALDGNLDFYKGEGHFDAFMIDDQGRHLFLSGYFQCSKP